jgi:hypothetical protein
MWIIVINTLFTIDHVDRCKPALHNYSYQHILYKVSIANVLLHYRTHTLAPAR